VHHVLARSFKDCFLRLPSRCWVGGWSGEAAGTLTASGRAGGGAQPKDPRQPEIEKFGVEEFNRLCRASVMQYIDEWERLTGRIGFWLDMEHAYRTFDPSYIESVWWSLKEIYDRGWLYRGYRVAPYCPRCQTSLSSHELAQPGAYHDDTPDPGVTVRFRLRDDPTTSLLAWTTTPWTFPATWPWRLR